MQGPEDGELNFETLFTSTDLQNEEAKKLKVFTRERERERERERVLRERGVLQSDALQMKSSFI